MEPHYYRARRAALHVEAGAILAVIPGLYVRQVWPDRRELPPDYSQVLSHELSGDLVPLHRHDLNPTCVPSLRPASPPRTHVVTIREPLLRLYRS